MVVLLQVVRVRTHDVLLLNASLCCSREISCVRACSCCLTSPYELAVQHDVSMLWPITSSRLVTAAVSLASAVWLHRTSLALRYRVLRARSPSLLRSPFLSPPCLGASCKSQTLVPEAQRIGIPGSGSTQHVPSHPYWTPVYTPSVILVLLCCELHLSGSPTAF